MGEMSELIYKRVTNMLKAPVTHCFHWLNCSPIIELE